MISEGSEVAQKEYKNYINNLEKFPITFTYGGKLYTGFGTDFNEKSRDTVKGNLKESNLIVLEHKESGIEIKIDAAIYPNYSAYEWTLFFPNTSNSNTAKLQDIWIRPLHIN